MIPGIFSFWWAADLVAEVFKGEAGSELSGGRMKQWWNFTRGRVTDFVDWARSAARMSSLCSSASTSSAAAAAAARGIALMCLCSALIQPIMQRLLALAVLLTRARHVRRAAQELRSTCACRMRNACAQGLYSHEHASCRCSTLRFVRCNFLIHFSTETP